MSMRTAERLAKIDRLIDYLAQERVWFPEPGVNSLLEFADLTEEEKEQARITLAAYDQSGGES
jgi:hypothetical protein